MADLDVTVGVDTAAAEEGLRRLSNVFHREIAAIDRTKAEAQVGIDATELKRQVHKAKRELLTLQEVKANPEVELDEKEFKAEVARLKMELKRLSLYKAEIQVEASQLKDANRLAAISVKRQEAMAKQTEKLDRAKERMARTTRRETVETRRAELQVHKLREAYAKLLAEEDKLDKHTGRPGGILRSDAENRRLEAVRAHLKAVREEIKEVGGTVDDIDLDRHGNILGRWVTNLSEVRLHLGFFSANLKQVGAGLVVLGPLLTGVLGAATSLVGVVGTSLAGALAVGAAGFAGFALAAGGAAAVIVPIVSELKEAASASEAYHKAVLKYGKGSEEANAAQEKLSQTLKGISPGARRTIQDVGKLKERWRELTSAAREPVFESAAEGIKTVEALMPTFAKQTVATTKVFAASWNDAMQALRSDGVRSGLTAVMTNFRSGLPSLLDGFGELASMFGRITVSASKFIPGLSGGFEAWARDLNHAVGYGDDLDSSIGRLVHHMQEFGHFSQATGRLLVALFDASADSGAGLLRTLTNLFNKWAAWMRTVEGRQSLQKFFAEAGDETREFGAMLGNLLEFFFQMSRVMAPLSDSTIKFLTAAGDIITAAQSIPGINVALQKTAELMALIFIVNRVRAFAGAVRGAAAALGLMGAAGTAGAAGSAGAGVAGGAAAGAAAGAAGSKLAKAGRMAGKAFGVAFAAVAVIEIGEAIRKATGAESNDALWPDSPISAKNLTEGKGGAIWGGSPLSIHTPLDDLLGLHEQEKELGEFVDHVGDRWNDAMTAINLSTIMGMQGINKSLARGLNVARGLWQKDPAEWRKRTVEAMRAAVDAIRAGMEAGTIPVKQGKERINKLLGAIKLRTGSDPLGVADGVMRSFKKAGAITSEGVQSMIRKLQRMPPKAREVAQDAILGMVKKWAAGHPKLEAQVNQLTRFMTNKFGRTNQQITGGIGRAADSIAGIFSNLVDSVSGYLETLGVNVQSILKALGVDKSIDFTVSVAKGVGHVASKAFDTVTGALGRQEGGFTVPGYGSGDHVRRALPSGSFVMNREASSYYGLNRGGSVQTILEPKERVFTPPEVKRYGAANLAAMNEAVPRQKGGGVGSLGRPTVNGPAGPLRDLGQAAAMKSYRAAQALLDRVQSSMGAGAPLPPGAPANLKAAMQLAQSMGLTITSTTGGEHAADSWHYKGRAFDASNGTATAEERNYAIAAARRWGSNILELFFDPLGWYIKNGQKVSGSIGDHSDHVHTAMLQGGLVQMLAQGGIVAERFAQSTAANSAPYNAAMALFEAGVVETGDPTLSTVPSGGDASSRGALQLLASTAQGLGVNPMNTRAVADLFYKRGFTGQGGAIALARAGMRPGDIAQAVQGSAYPERYAQQAGVARSLIEGAGLHYNGQEFKGYGTAEGGGRKGLPDSVKADVRSYRTTASGGLIGTERKDVPVPLTVPDFGPLPEKEGEVRKELIELERRTMPEYRSALRQHKDKKAIAAKLRECLAKIEQRIRDLRGKLRELRYAKAKKRVSKKLGKQLGRITGFEPRIEAARTAYEEKDQYAAQVVGQEPEQPGELTSDWITKTLDPYVTQQETPAYAAVLDAENTWRNMILGAEEAAGGITKGWETTIGYPQAKRKPFLENPDLHWPPGADPPTGLAQWIYSLHDQIDRIREFANSKTPKWWSEHPAARKQRDAELGTIDTWLAPQLGLARHRRKGTIGALAEGRSSFDWFHGTGTFEESLRDVQGLHRYPEQHEKLASLPGLPVPGVFGGAIYDTQETIQDLGLKVQQARESLDSGASDADKAAEISGFEEAIRGLLAGRPFLQDTHRGPQQPYMGAYAKGGVALVGERGPELAHMPHGTRIHDAEDTARLLEPKVVVDLARLNYGPFSAKQQGSTGKDAGGKVYNVTNNFDAPPPDPHTWTRQQDFELRTLS